jgi:peptide/nickel transport system permease protein
MSDRTTPEKNLSPDERAALDVERQHIVAEVEPGVPVVETVPPPETGGEIIAAPLAKASARGRSPSRILWMKLRRNRTAMFGLYTLALLYASSILAGFLAPYRYDYAATSLPFYPPMLTRIHFFDESGSLTRPFVYGVRPVVGLHAVYEEDRTRTYPIRFFARGGQYHILWIIKSDIHLFGVDTPGHIFLFGSDGDGQDIFSRILYGAQVSLSIGIVGIVISTALGMLIGGISGYFGGATDFTLMRAVEVLLAIPSLYFILIMRNMFGSAMSTLEIYFVIVIILALIGWATEARVIRGMVLSLKEQDYVVAARALGYSDARIIVRHILPNTLSFVIVTATLSVPFYILGEVALSFLGVGIQLPEASWGNMLIAARNNYYLKTYPWMLTPGLFIFIAVMAWNFLGDGLRDAADPRTLS